jgi:hypothetical protein
MRTNFCNTYAIKSYQIKKRFLVRLHNIILCKYCEKDIVPVLHYTNNDGIAFVATLIVTLNLQWCKYCKLGFENKMGHVLNQCLHVKMKVLLVGFVLF